MTETAELKPCPFCGRNGSLSINALDKVVLCSCLGCGATATKIRYSGVLVSTDLQKAVEAWNRRAGEECTK